MPTYNLRNKRTGKTKQIFMGISEMEIWEKDNLGWEVLAGCPLIHSGFRTGESKSDSWNDLLKQVKKRNPHSNIKLNK